MKKLQRYLLYLPMLVVTGLMLLLLIVSLIDLMATGKDLLFTYSMVSILVLPLPLIFASISVFIKMKNYSGKYRYGIRFWPAVMKAPRFAVLGIYVTVILFILTLILSSIRNSDNFALTGGLILFYYVSFVIFWSGFREIS